MSTRLDQALAEIADAAGQASRLSGPAEPTAAATVHRIAARVRRRRAVRVTAGGAVAASAAGAVALVAPGLGSTAVVASRPDAPVGTCGSSLAGVPVDATSEVALRVFPAGSLGVGGGAPGADLGTWAGPLVAVDVEEPVGDGGAREPEVDVVVAAGDVVVSTVTASVDQRLPFGLLDATGAAVPDGEVWSAGGVGVPLESCDDGARLPAGPYTVWTVRTPDGARTPELTGPWPIAVASAPEGLGRLPADFPRDLPVVGTGIVSVGPHGRGWGIEVTAEGEDRAAVAALALEDTGAVVRTENLGDEVLRTRSGWDVRVLPSHTPEGETSVVYDVRPVR